MEEKIRVTFSGMDTSEALRDYAIEKFSKREHSLQFVTNLEVVMTQHVSHRGVSKDFELEAIAKVPKTIVKVSERGEDMYALVDSASDTMFRGLKRYNDKLGQWEGKSPWKVSEEELVDDNDDIQSFTDYVPTIVERREIQYLTPMEEAEAIERMELLGRDHMLFNNLSNGKFSLVYKLITGGYGIEEVPDGI